jgi:hypothetical protein
MNSDWTARNYTWAQRHRRHPCCHWWAGGGERPAMDSDWTAANPPRVAAAVYPAPGTARGTATSTVGGFSFILLLQSRT